MDAPHVQPVVGLHESFTWLQVLLRRDLGEAGWSAGMGCSSAAPGALGSLLARAARLERTGFAYRTAGARLLRLNVGRLRGPARPRREAGAALATHCRNAKTRLAAPHKAPAERRPTRTLR